MYHDNYLINIQQSELPRQHSKMSHLVKSRLMKRCGEQIYGVSVLGSARRQPLVESGRFLEVWHIRLLYVVVRTDGFLQVLSHYHTRALDIQILVRFLNSVSFSN